MSDKKDGGSAFPVPDYPRGSGMSLRDWFASQALNGLLSNSTLKQTDFSMSGQEAVAKGAYMIADAMLKEREK